MHVSVLRSLLLLLLCLLTSDASTQEAQLPSVKGQISTTSFVLTWEKIGPWKDVMNFHVNVSMNDFPFCSSDFLCFSVSQCIFKSADYCSSLAPCAQISATVSGGNFTSPAVNMPSAPAPVTQLEVTDQEHFKNITWVNPTSPCHRDTEATIIYGGYLKYTKILNTTDTSLLVPVCMAGLGSVTLRTRGNIFFVRSDPATVAIIKLSGDAVRITSCPPQGCTDVEVQWQYEPVCPEVVYFNVTLGSKYLETPNISVTNTTFTNLSPKTQYNTCVEALGPGNFLLARHCTLCSTQLEVVNQLNSRNVTDTSVEIEWQSPLCPTDAEVEYSVSCPTEEGINHSYPTTDTTLLCSGLNPATFNEVCVTVVRNWTPIGPPTCVLVFTLPSALEKVVVSVFDQTSLYIHWPAPLFTPNYKYRVSWGEDLENSNYTLHHSYTIEGYNTTAGPDKVCVEVETKIPKHKRSAKTCQEAPFRNFKKDKPKSTMIIIGVSVSAGVAVLLSVLVVVIVKKQARR